MKKIFLSLLFFVTLCISPSWSIEAVNYDGVDTSTVSVETALVRVSSMERELTELPKNKDFSKEFSIYFNNLLATQSYIIRDYATFESIYNNPYIVLENKEYGYYFSNPKVEGLFIKSDMGANCFIDYNALLGLYEKSLSSAWKTYLNYQINEENTYYNLEELEGDPDYAKVRLQAQKDLVKSWFLFTLENPTFSLNKSIKADINQKIQYIIDEDENYFFLGDLFNEYKIVFVSIVIIPILLIGFVLFFIKKRSSIGNLFITIKNKIVNACKSVLQLVIAKKTYILALLGIVAIVGIVCCIHQANSLPTCDSEFAENQVKTIFLQQTHDERSSIHVLRDVYIDSDITFSEPEPLHYDKDINKYTCRARIDRSRSRFDYWLDWKGDIYQATYDIYKVNGNNVVSASFSKTKTVMENPNR